MLCHQVKGQECHQVKGQACLQVKGQACPQVKGQACLTCLGKCIELLKYILLLWQFGSDCAGGCSEYSGLGHSS